MPDFSPVIAPDRPPFDGMPCASVLPASLRDRAVEANRSLIVRHAVRPQGVVHARLIWCMPSPLNPSRKKHRFGKAWMHEHVTDPYVKEAARRGYRSRAAFKLLELAERDALFQPGMTVVDLGAAPGSWSQVLRERLGGKSTIVAVDLLPMQGLPGVQVVQGDLESDTDLATIEQALDGKPADLVISDMAPNLSGIDVVDQARSVRLAELALDFGLAHLQPGGDLVIKVFQGAGLDAFQRLVRADFSKVYLRKPKASRERSREHYVVAKGRLGTR
jgi:23S rRNA (uridine2552-2'-O)-methyltransferase